jgi:mono/diheme cytochrome c family protein
MGAHMKKIVMLIVGAAAVIAVIAIVANGGNTGTADAEAGGNEFNIPVQDPILVAEGGVLYQANCALCHGADLRGTDLGPSHLSVVYQPGHHGDGAFALASINGVRAHHWEFGDMVSMPGLSQEDLDRIIAFVRETQRIEGFEPYPPG